MPEQFRDFLARVPTLTVREPLADTLGALTDEGRFEWTWEAEGPAEWIAVIRKLPVA